VAAVTAGNTPRERKSGLIIIPPAIPIIPERILAKKHKTTTLTMILELSKLKSFSSNS